MSPCEGVERARPVPYLVLVGPDELAGVDERVAEEVDVALLGLALAPVDVDLGQRALRVHTDTVLG